jgi:hypothetical protein
MSGISVLHLAHGLGVGGAQKCLEVAARNLDDRFTSHICGLGDGGERGDALKADGYDVFIVDDGRDLTQEIAARDIDLLHIFGRGPGEVPVSAATNAGVSAVVKTTNFGWVDKPAVAKHVDTYLFQSKTMLLRYLLVNNYDLADPSWHDAYKVLYNPIVLDEVTTAEGHDYRDELGLDPDVPIAGKIGRPAAAKWGKITVRGFARVHERLPEARLLLVTPPEPIRREVQRLGLEDATTYLDTVPPDEVSRFYNTIDVLTHSSAIGEAFGNVLAETLAHRKPIVVDSDPIRDNGQLELVENGATGYVANAPEAYGDATLELLRNHDLADRLGRPGREKIERGYSSDSYVDRLQRIHLAALDDRTGSDRIDVIPEDGIDMIAFKNEYDRRLREHYGSAGVKYHLEYAAWLVASKTPVPKYHEEFYKSIRIGAMKILRD